MKSLAKPTRKRYPTDVRRQELTRIARDLCAEDGPGELRLREVARRAGVSAAAIYKHFDCLDDLIAAILSDHLTELDAIYDDTVRLAPADAMRRVCCEHTKLFAANPGAARLIHADLCALHGIATHAEVEAKFAVLNAREAEIINEGVHKGVFHKVAPFDVTVARIGVTLTLLSIRGLGPTAISEDQIIKVSTFVTEMILSYLVQPKLPDTPLSGLAGSTDICSIRKC